MERRWTRPDSTANPATRVSGLLAALSEFGYLDAAVCARGDSLWRIDPGSQLAEVRLDWRVGGEGAP
ncbi:MAG: hypothetical protein GF330_13480, partial [Candidatus Eisenbacteria bacterium]|nr:hypothetical protein [Candidatus Eisenbacteria bacterium]